MSNKLVTILVGVLFVLVLALGGGSIPAKLGEQIAVAVADRTWPDTVIDHAPMWCAVDLRDGNQALVEIAARIRQAKGLDEEGQPIPQEQKPDPEAASVALKNAAMTEATIAMIAMA